MTRAIRGLVLIGLCACSFADNHSTVTVTDAWIPEGPPTSPFIAVYLSIKNLGNHPRRLLTARHASGRAAVIHQTSEVNGVARMSSVDGLTVAPGASIEFAPGGYHLMLKANPGEFRAGQIVALEFLLADDSVLPFQAKVWHRDDRMALHRDANHDH